MSEIREAIEIKMNEHFDKARELRITGRSLKQEAEGVRRGTPDYIKAIERVHENEVQVSRHIGSARAYQKVLEMME